jgi:hypothetical protein
MNRIEELIGMARDLAEGVVEIAGGLLSTGVDLTLAHIRYVAPAIELLSDAEMLALRAVADDGDALIALERATTALADLRDKALAELDQSERP